MCKTGLILIVSFLLFLNGCTVIFQKGRRSDINKIDILESELQELRVAKGFLEDRLSQEIEDEKVKLTLVRKGLVITFVAEVLFNSGKAKLRKDSLSILDKVVEVLKETVPDNKVGIGGHTDNEPIKHSRWKSNWELSAQRAISVVHHLERRGVVSGRLSAIGYGEHQPVVSNDTVQGRQLNRRVEIVILPRSAKEKMGDKTSGIEEELK